MSKRKKDRPAPPPRPEPTEDVEGLGLRCPLCESAWSRVVRTVRLAGLIRRERACQHCGRRFHTTEATR